VATTAAYTIHSWPQVSAFLPFGRALGQRRNPLKERLPAWTTSRTCRQMPQSSIHSRPTITAGYGCRIEQYRVTRALSAYCYYATAEPVPLPRTASIVLGRLSSPDCLAPGRQCPACPHQLLTISIELVLQPQGPAVLGAQRPRTHRHHAPTHADSALAESITVVSSPRPPQHHASPA
jgi:hypothetical protein